MAGAKHTPGPWVAEQTEEQSIIGEWTIKDDDGGYIADVRNPYQSLEQQVGYANWPECPLEAIANLIAAAPDLIDALRAQMRATEIALRSSGASDRDIADCTSQARAAIAKATLTETERSAA